MASIISAASTVNPRHLMHVFLILFEKQDPISDERRPHDVRGTGETGGRSGCFGEYRSHLAFMDEVGEQYAYGGHALRRLVETLKDGLDPNGILSPGKQGIWPAGMRGGGW